MKNIVYKHAGLIVSAAMLLLNASSQFTIRNGAQVIATHAPSPVLQVIDFVNYRPWFTRTGRWQNNCSMKFRQAPKSYGVTGEKVS